MDVHGCGMVATSHRSCCWQRRTAAVLYASAASLDAALVRVEDDKAAGVLTAYYKSQIFGDDISIIVTHSSVLMKSPAPLGLRKANADFLPGPIYENYLLPNGSSQYSLINHVSIFYNSFGMFPYPTGQSNPTPKSNSTKSLTSTCVTCYFYITFFFIPADKAKLIGADCSTNGNLFCDVSEGPFVFREPNAVYLPPSFSNATGDLFSGIVVRSTASSSSSNVAPVRSLSPLAASQLGLLWVNDEVTPKEYGYNGEAVLGPANYYASDNATIVGVGQVVSSTYFNFFASYFVKNEEDIRNVDSAGPFGSPSNFTYNGMFPTAAVSTINGYRGGTVFTFGFSSPVNVTSDIPPKGSLRALPSQSLLMMSALAIVLCLLLV